MTHNHNNVCIVICSVDIFCLVYGKSVAIRAEILGPESNYCISTSIYPSI